MGISTQTIPNQKNAPIWEKMLISLKKSDFWRKIQILRLRKKNWNNVALAGNRTRAAGMGGEHYTTYPRMFLFYLFTYDIWLCRWAKQLWYYIILDVHHHFNRSKWMPENCNARKLPTSYLFTYKKCLIYCHFGSHFKSHFWPFHCITYHQHHPHNHLHHHFHHDNYHHTINTAIV